MDIPGEGMIKRIDKPGAIRMTEYEVKIIEGFDKQLDNYDKYLIEYEETWDNSIPTKKSMALRNDLRSTIKILEAHDLYDSYLYMRPHLKEMLDIIKNSTSNERICEHCESQLYNYNCQGPAQEMNICNECYQDFC